MSGGEKRVLYVEADGDRSQVLSRIFSDLNYGVFTTSTSTEAGEAWKSTRPDIVVLNADGEGESPGAVASLQEKNGKTPFVILSSDPAFGEGLTLHGSSRVLHLPAPDEDVVDCVERAIGLPSAPKEVAQVDSQGGDSTPMGSVQESSAQIFSSEIDEIEYKRMESEVESLHEQLHFYQKQLDQVSVAGEREGREIDQVLKDFQEEITNVRRERDGFQDEIGNLKRELKEKGKEISEFERKWQVERKDRISELETQKKEVGKLRLDIENEGDKHKRAQSALREFYKKKLVKSDQIKADLKKLEGQLDKERKASKEYAAKLKKAQDGLSDVGSLKKEVKEFKEKSEALAKEKDQIMRDLVHAKEEAEETKKKLDSIKKALGS